MARSKSTLQEHHGLLVIDKPARMTSRDVVDRASGWFPRGTRLGHTGTLDPLATGVLVLCVGVATRLAEFVQDMPKTYRAQIKLGGVSDTDDADGAITLTPNMPKPTQAMLEDQLRRFVGTIEQIPPAYSAAKVVGRRAYELARKGQDFDLTPRAVTIHALDLIRYDCVAETQATLEIVVRCSKGTYIRSLARDLGQRLGSGGYIESLRRLQVGAFSEARAITLEAEPAEARRELLPLAMAVTELPRITLVRSEAIRLLHGQRLAAPPEACDGQGAVFAEAGPLVAIAEVTVRIAAGEERSNAGRCAVIVRQ